MASALAIALCPTHVVFAQEATAPAERVVVTGTRLPPPDLAASSPIAVLRGEDIAKDGPLPLEQILASLPMVFGDQNSMVSNTASGTSSVDLRSLGAFRALTLINGRRLGAGAPLFDASDINAIPSALVRRVEVLTGGASAIYGSDALAGVVNFIMNNRFEGLQGEVNYSFFNHRQQNPHGIADIIRARAVTNPAQYRVPGDKSSDGESLVVNLLLGSDFANNRGNATVFFGYREDKALLESERDYSACAVDVNQSGFLCGGSSTSYPGRFWVNPPRGPQLTPADTTGGVRVWLPATDLYNFAPTNYYRRPTERYNFGAFVDYAVGPNTTVYNEFLFHDDHTVAQIAESGMFGIRVPVSFENPLLSADWRDRLGLRNPGDSVNVLINRRNFEGGGRRADLRHTSFREVVGVRGAITDAWHYDAYLQTGKVVYQQVYFNDFSNARSIRAMDVVSDPATGRAVCRSVLDGSDPLCVPYNIWTIGGVTPEALAYLQTPGFLRGSASQDVFSGSVTADLGAYGMRFPGAKEPVSMALGLERRKQEQILDADTAFASGDLAGQIGGTPSVAGAYSVKEAFGEVRVPVHDVLSLNGSFRYSRYSTGIGTTSYGAGFDLQPVQQVRLRGSYQRATRAPRIGELFFPQQVELLGIAFADPCAGAAPARSREDCRRTGVTVAQYGAIEAWPTPNSTPAFIRLGGNPRLQPETGNTLTLGIVLTPWRDLSATLDYFNIRIDDTITFADPSVAVSQCLDTGDPLYCDRIRRDPASGTLWLPGAEIDATNINSGRLQTSGADVGINYKRTLGEYGSLGIDALGSYMHEYTIEAYRGAPSHDCSGLFSWGCYQPRPKWRHRLRATWNTPWDLDIAATWRHIDSVEFAGARVDPVVPFVGTVPDMLRTLSARNYLDLTAAWRPTKQLTVRVGVSNVLDRDPPIVPAGAPYGNGNTWVNTYDPLGRRIWVNLAARF